MCNKADRFSVVLMKTLGLRDFSRLKADHESKKPLITNASLEYNTDLVFPGRQRENEVHKKILAYLLKAAVSGWASFTKP